MDKRKFSRTSFETHGSVVIGNQSTRFAVLDISLHGALIQTERPDLLEPGDEAELVFRLSGSGIRIPVQAELVRKQETKLAFTFTLIDAESLTHLRRIMEFNLADADRVQDELAHLIRDDSQ